NWNCRAAKIAVYRRRGDRVITAMPKFGMNRSIPAFISYCFMAIVGASVALAEDYPVRPIRIVVGFTAGGPLDLPVRFIAERLSKSIGKSVVVENKPGAGSMLATLDVLSQPRDGYNLLACTYFDPVNTLLYKKARYKVAD